MRSSRDRPEPEDTPEADQVAARVSVSLEVPLATAMVDRLTDEPKG